MNLFQLFKAWPPPHRRCITIPQFKLIYLQIPKTGCTSIKSALISALGERPPEDDEKVHDFPFQQIPPRELSASEYQEYFRFTFVRNPWERLVSCYFNKVKERSPEIGIFGPFHKFKKFHAQMSFEEFALAVCEIPDSLANSHFASQHVFLADGVDFVGRYDRLPSDFAWVASRLGLPEVSLPHRMVSHHDPYCQYYSEPLREKVRRRYADDIERFGFQFGASE